MLADRCMRPYSLPCRMQGIVCADVIDGSREMVRLKVPFSPPSLITSDQVCACPCVCVL